VKVRNHSTMESFELKLHRILVSTGMEEEKASELTEILSVEINTRISTNTEVATKADVNLILQQIRTLQWLFGAVGIPILVAIFLQFFS